MGSHIRHRAVIRRARRHSGFTMLEVVVAMTILMLSITTVTAAIAEVQTSSAQTRVRGLVLDAVQADAAVIASQPASSLTGGTFTVPHPCPGHPSDGCVQVGQHTYTITWTVAPVSVDNPGLLVTGSTTVAGSTVTVTRSVNP